MVNIEDRHNMDDTIHLSHKILCDAEGVLALQCTACSLHKGEVKRALAAVANL